MRFIAASLVLYGHCYPITNRGTYDEITLASRGIFPAAHMGVCIFFVVSGYLVTQSMKNSKTISEFVWKRIVRIFPALIVSLLLCVLVVGPLCTTLPINQYFNNPETYSFFKLIKLFPYVDDKLPGVFKNLPTDHVNSSLWTLPYEVTMYFVLVILQKINLLNKRNVLLVFGVIGFAFCVDATLNITHAGIYSFAHARLIPVLHLSLVDTLDFGLYFMMGTLLNVFQDKFTYQFPVFIPMIFLWFGLGFMNVTNPTSIKIISYIALPYMVLYLANIKGKINDFGKLGDFSYGIYIYAFPVQQAIIYFYGVDISITKLFLLTVLIVLPMSILSWYLVEKRALTFKNLNFSKILSL